MFSSLFYCSQKTVWWINYILWKSLKFISWPCMVDLGYVLYAFENNVSIVLVAVFYKCQLDEVGLLCCSDFLCLYWFLFFLFFFLYVVSSVPESGILKQHPAPPIHNHPSYDYGLAYFLLICQFLLLKFWNSANNPCKFRIVILSCKTDFILVKYLPFLWEVSLAKSLYVSWY